MQVDLLFGERRFTSGISSLNENGGIRFKVKKED